jgi:hypothetical protein
MQEVIARLPAILKEKNPSVIIELGCGDLNFARHALFQSGAQYRGFDIKSHPSWEAYDCTESNILDVRQFTAEIVVARDVFIHLPNEMILQVLRKTRCDWFISTTYPGADNSKRMDKPSAGYRALDLTKEPFNFPQPETLIPEHSKGKFLGVFDARTRNG